jgi:hypothetical protein
VIVNELGHLFAGTMKRGVLRSTDDGKTWNSINNGLPVMSAPARALDKKGYIYCGVLLNGLYRIAVPTTNNKSPL